MLSYLEISKSALLQNYRTLRKTITHVPTAICVVKGNAYGHGLEQVVEILNSEVEYFGVNSLEELRSLRKYSQKPTLVMGYVQKKLIRELVDLKADVVVYDPDWLKELNDICKKTGVKTRVHLKIDAEFGRQGILPNQVNDFAKKLMSFDSLDIFAVYAHFANIDDDFSENSHARKQLLVFENAVTEVKKAFPKIKSHISATAGSFMYERGNKSGNDFVRLGLGLYGLWPSEFVKKQNQDIKLLPVGRWVSHVAQIKILPANHTIGYGLTYKTTSATKVAVVPQGYSDGYDRGLSNLGEVLIRGKRCSILGRVMMNLIVVDVSHIPQIFVEDEVVLLGSQSNEEITAEEIAQKLDTINYEVVTRISSLLPRVIVD